MQITEDANKIKVLKSFIQRHVKLYKRFITSRQANPVLGSLSASRMGAELLDLLNARITFIEVAPHMSPEERELLRDQLHAIDEGLTNIRQYEFVRSR